MPSANTIIKISVISATNDQKRSYIWEKKKMSLALPIRQEKTVAELEKQSTEVESPSACAKQQQKQAFQMHTLMDKTKHK